MHSLEETIDSLVDEVNFQSYQHAMGGNRYMNENEIAEYENCANKFNKVMNLLGKYKEKVISLEILIGEFCALDLQHLICVDYLPHCLVKKFRLVSDSCIECEAVERFLLENEKNPPVVFISTIMEELIPNLPVFFMERYVDCVTLEKYWNLIPESKKTYLEGCRPCYEHYNTGRTQWEGGPLSKRKCVKCQENYKNNYYDFYL